MAGYPWMLVVILLQFMSVDTEPNVFSFASYYGTNMVLQRGPKRAIIWGYARNTEGTVKLSLSTVGTYTAKVTNTTMGGVWSVKLPPVTKPGPYSITATMVGESAISISNILFGDVWLCSGQSNMQFTVRMGFNATEEIAQAHLYPDVRVFTVSLKSSDKPQYDLLGVEEPWSVPSNASIGDDLPWTYFSAICWLYGKYIHQKLQRPIGLVASTWGGTPIEYWSSPTALKECGIHEPSKNGVSLSSNSILWNAMIHPFLKMTIYGAIWYQGESNAAYPDTYNCTFPAMIKDWRHNFFLGSDNETSPWFPFGFVQLAPFRDNPDLISGTVAIRWHQTADYGFVPNVKMVNTFMAVTMDLPDFKSPWGGIHPRDKITVARRLTIAGLSVAYDMDLQYQGPLPSRYNINAELFTLDLEFDYGKSSLQIRSPNGFEVCCTPDKDASCNSTKSTWAPAPITDSSDHFVTLSYKQHCSNKYIVGLRYAWRESPCEYLNCAVYEKTTELPAPPFIRLMNFGGEASAYIRTKVTLPKGSVSIPKTNRMWTDVLKAEDKLLIEKAMKFYTRQKKVILN